MPYIPRMLNMKTKVSGHQANALHTAKTKWICTDSCNVSPDNKTNFKFLVQGPAASAHCHHGDPWGKVMSWLAEMFEGLQTGY